MGTGRVAALGMFTAMLVAGCSSSTPTARPTSSPVLPTAETTAGTIPATEMAATAVPSPTSAPATDSLGIVVVGSGTNAGIWTVNAGGTWTRSRTIDGASAIAPSTNGVAIAAGDEIHFLEGPRLSDVSQTRLSWPGGVARPIASFAIAGDGRLALAVGKDDDYEYAMADAQGHVGPMEVAASQPLSPLVAWLGTDRRLVLATDAKEVSRLAVEDASSHVTFLTGLSGCRWFGASVDAKTIAALTETGLYIDSTDRFLASVEPPKAAAIADATVAWAVAVSHDGTRVAYLTGRLADDGSVSDVHEHVLIKAAVGWHEILDSKGAFSSVIGQAWTS